VDDAEDPWTFSERFDFIHLRMVHLCFPLGPDIITKAYDYLEPGGYLEFQDAVFPPTSTGDLRNTNFEDWTNKIISAGKQLGKDFECVEKYAQYMSDAGFVDVHVRTFCWPIGDWHDDSYLHLLGTEYLPLFLEELEALTLVLTRFGHSLLEVDSLLRGVKEEILKSRVRLQTKM
jgi:hypothetical protein